MKRDLAKDETKETDVVGKLTDAGLFDDFTKAVAAGDESRMKSILESVQVSDEQIGWWQLYLSYYMERLKIDDPNGFIPLDKHDHERADRAIAAGYPAVEPVLGHLLEWIQDCNWPVGLESR